MKTIRGKFNEALIFTDLLEDLAAEQIKDLCDQEFTAGSKIRIMPDTHAGAGCTIGTTMTVTDKIVPNIVGVDIGCGMLVHQLKPTQVEFARLDQVLRTQVPSGFSVRKTPHEFVGKLSLGDLKCVDNVNLERARLSIGTLGGGNHFIEIDRDEEGDLYLVIHSGSRYLGKQIAEHYQQLAANLRSAKRRSGDLKRSMPPAEKLDKQLAYLEGRDFYDYIQDMKIAQHYADVNRQAIAQQILQFAGLKSLGSFSTVHNYIDTDLMIVRKGAISARKGERVLIPMNMRDGSIIAMGRGNQDWNESAPHGAGRLMSRRQAMKTLSMQDYHASMKGIFTTTLTKKTLDEAPAAYKPMAEIIENMRDTVDIVKLVQPIYNFKATGD